MFNDQVIFDDIKEMNECFPIPLDEERFSEDMEEKERIMTELNSDRLPPKNEICRSDSKPICKSIDPMKYLKLNLEDNFVFKRHVVFKDDFEPVVPSVIIGRPYYITSDQSEI